MTYLVNGIECRTRQESLIHIAQQAKLKKIGPKNEHEHGFCEYRYASGNNCAVGALFSKAQLDQIDAWGCTSTSINQLALVNIGKRNVETITGMKLKELEIIQKIHDDTLQSHGAQEARDGVRIYCEKELEKLQAKQSETPQILRSETA